MKKQDQHYVPQVYLKRFAFDSEKKLYYFKKKPKSKKDRVKWTHAAKVCYEPDRFRIKNLHNLRHLGIDDEYYIEKNLFKYENTELTNIFDVIERRAALSRSNAKRLLEIIFSIKRRNPVFGNLFTPQNTVNIGKKTIQELRILIEQTSEILDSSHPIIKECMQYLEEDLKDPEFAKDLYNGVLIEVAAKDSEGDKERIEHILNKNFTVLQTTSKMPFITSDNPGYTLDINRQVFNLDIASVDRLIFPLSPLSLLIVSLKEHDRSNKYLISKNIDYRFASPKEVLSYNEGTLINCISRVFGSDKKSLDMLRDIFY